MKVLIVNSFYYPNMIGGAENSVKNIAETLIEKNNDVYVLCLDKEESYKEINGVKVYSIKNLNIKNSLEYNTSKNNPFLKLVYRGIELTNGVSSIKIKKILDLIKPDVIHINNFAGFGTALFRTIKTSNIPVIFTARDYYTICPKSTLINSSNVECSECKFICKIYKKIYSNVLNNVDYISAPSNFILDVILNGVKLSNKNKGIVIHNSIDINDKYIQDIYNKKISNIGIKETIDFVFVGRLELHKGIQILLEKFIGLKDKNVKLHIAGDGKLSDFVREQTDNENIIYYGMLSKHELEQLLIKCDILFAPSLWNEPFGRVVLDAYKHCLPVITTGNGGLKELVKSGYTGEIINFESNDEFCETIKRYRSNKKLLADQIQNTYKEIVKYSNANIIDNYISLYNKAIDNKKSAI